MKHTKGPWNINGFFITAKHGDRKKSVVADIDRHAWYREGEATANARLIAAAPELLEACELALSGLRSIYDRLEMANEAIAIDIFEDESGLPLELLSKAINKAESI